MFRMLQRWRTKPRWLGEMNWPTTSQSTKFQPAAKKRMPMFLMPRGAHSGGRPHDGGAAAVDGAFGKEDLQHIIRPSRQGVAASYLVVEEGDDGGGHQLGGLPCRRQEAIGPRGGASSASDHLDVEVDGRRSSARGVDAPASLTQEGVTDDAGDFLVLSNVGARCSHKMRETSPRSHFITWAPFASEMRIEWIRATTT